VIEGALEVVGGDLAALAREAHLAAAMAAEQVAVVVAQDRVLWLLWVHVGLAHLEEES